MFRCTLLVGCLMWVAVAGWAQELEQAATGFRFTEGPVVAADGSVYFTDLPTQRILRYLPGEGDADGAVQVFREESGRANGLTLDDQGRLLACEMRSRRVTRTEPDGSLTVLAESYQGKRLNSPNDLVLDAAGGIYFTDPRYGKRDDMELDVEAVYYLPADGGELRQLITDLVRPNGIMLSPDGQTLYVADHGDKKIWSYPITGAGEIGAGQLFVDTAELGGCDGMSVDAAGRLYTTLDDGVHVYSPAGEHVAHIATPERPANVAVDGDVVWVTARTSLYRGQRP